MTTLKIAVLDFGSSSVDIIKVDQDFIQRNYHGDTELFLYYWCGYDMDNIQWIADNKLEENLNMTIDDFDGDDDILSNNTEEDEAY